MPANTPPPTGRQVLRRELALSTGPLPPPTPPGGGWSCCRTESRGGGVPGRVAPLWGRVLVLGAGRQPLGVRWRSPSLSGAGGEGMRGAARGLLATAREGIWRAFEGGLQSPAAGLQGRRFPAGSQAGVCWYKSIPIPSWYKSIPMPSWS